MWTIEKSKLPNSAVLAVYTRRGAYTDCFRTRIPGTVTLAEFVSAFYTSWLFKLERIILRWAVSRPSTDIEAGQLAAGRDNTFAVWHVEQRVKDQLLMCDFRERPRSWFMVRPDPDSGNATTELYFGSAVVAISSDSEGRGFRRPRHHLRLLLGLHRIYSRALLAAARARLAAA